MPLQRDLPESIAWCIIKRLKSGQTQTAVMDTFGVARSVISRLWNLFQETGHVRRRAEQDRSRATSAVNDQYILLTARRDRLANETPIQRKFFWGKGNRTKCLKPFNPK
ncbi:hypothetical protein TNCV_2642341 [Trichonephila clavipes]|nr:hypothetical protein TNCV_2642341 [Trichonephila clavipes]